MDSIQTERWGNVKNLFALIIGIDDYSHAPKLKGAVADADRFRSFLVDHIGANNDRIITLRNKNATREAIVGAFRSLWECQSIQHENPILIFYAGHGCEMPRPKCWETGGRDVVQAICPCDMTRGVPSKQAIYPIPDLTIAIWLNVLSCKKGNNITVIFDCCHSAGGTRVSEEGVRCLEFDGGFPRALEKEFVHALKTVGRGSLNNPNRHSRSHVLLAACSATENAKEVNNKGLFTTELLRALQEPGVDQLSFLEFTGRLQHLTGQNSTRQTPQCYGHFKDRVLFSNLLKLGSDVFPVSWEHENRTCRIEAGAIHGVDKGSLFDMYETAADTMATKPLCTLTAREVHPLHTIASITEAKVRLPGVPRVARQVRSGKALKVHFTPAFLTVAKHEEVLYLHDIHRKVKVEANAASADLIIDMKYKNVMFTANIKAVASHGFKRLPQCVPAEPERVARVLLAASRWTQHLEVSRNHLMAKDINIEFFLLEKSHSRVGRFIMKPKGNKLNVGNQSPGRLKPKNICKMCMCRPGKATDDLVYLDVKPGNKNFYGMKIHNNTETDLRLSMLAFDVGSLSITSRGSGSIGVHSTGDADPTLYSKTFLPYGYGNGGEIPLHFQPHDDINATVLKFYFTSHPMDLKWLEQASPFGDPQDDRHFGPTTRREATMKRLHTSPIAFTKSLTIVLGAPPS